MENNKVAGDENRRVGQLASVKSQVEGDVNAEIAAKAEVATPAEDKRIEQVAGQFRGKAIDEVVGTEREVTVGRNMARVSQVFDYAFCIIYGLLVIRLMLALMAARSSAGFVQFIYAITDPLYAPFRGIVGSPSVNGYTLALPIIIALVVYLLLHAGINGFLRVIAQRKTEI